MLPTPSTSHVPYDRVYEPAEDSYLLLDTLSSKSETQWLHDRFASAPTPLICEIGTGSGVVLAFVAANTFQILGRSDILAIGVDINHFACKATTRTVHQAIEEHAEKSASRPLFLGAVHGDLTTALKPASLDVLIFNPPYVPAPLPDNALHRHDDQISHSSHEAFERDSHLLALSYAGGEDGMEVTNRLLDDIPRVLTTRGVAYVLLCAQNKPKAVIDKVKSWSSEWDACIAGDSGGKAGWEKLVVLRICRNV
ncbi:hypothetical protein KVT40_001617 [Elsinoe batatas]|uniref:ERF1 methyltransferase catalytic subunit MTQ2 n=1 Tax=Elsinoe batatas TaxID=2601811 RepID=A0A8K0PJX6_9PEZI|nr:hypothetical protein KVT40_001617 [Elsinoe batatas]